MRKEDFLAQIKRIRAAAMKDHSVPMREYLNSLNDDDLFVVIAALTLSYGRTYKDSIANAESHMLNRENAINCFS